MAKESEQKLRVELSCVNLVQTIPRELDKLHWIGEGMLTKLDIIFKALSINALRAQEQSAAIFVSYENGGLQVFLCFVRFLRKV